MRLIDADALAECPIPKGERNYRTYNLDDAYEDGYYNAMADIRNAPSIDIVRCAECKACKRKRGTFKGEPIIFYRCEENNRDVESDDYCSWGEREGE